MNPVIRGRSFRASVRVLAVIAVTGITGLNLGPGGVRTSAQGPPAPLPSALPFSAGYLITGDYVVSGVDLPKAGGMGTINLNDARFNGGVEVVAAYLYWETISRGSLLFTDVTYRGAPITGAKATTIKTLPGLPAASCWGAAGSGSSTLAMFKADVLALLEKQLDADGKWTGKYLVNDADLLGAQKSLHTVKLPQQGTGNVLTQSAGASLLLVFRDLAHPLKKIVVYDGAYAQAQGTTMTQTIRGIYKSAVDPTNQLATASITHIVGSGAGNTGERLLFNGSVVPGPVNPVPAPIGSGADRGWANPTRNVTSLMPGIDYKDGYGETVTTAVDHGKTNQNSTPYECLSWAATVFSTPVADADRDGLPDGIEAATAGLKDPATPSYPAGRPLPNLNAMGAKVGPKDLFVEINAMWAPENTEYGAPNSAYYAKDTQGHNHLPRPEVLEMVGKAYSNNGIAVHFDVGDVADYHALPGYACPAAPLPCLVNNYLVPTLASDNQTVLARGGEAIQERACGVGGDVKCQFPLYPGTVGWRLGVQLYKDAPVGDAGEELIGPAQSQAWGGENRRRRFDRDRRDFFHYLLYAHARGKAKSDLPCLSNGQPAGYGAGTNSCTEDNPLFHAPTSASGIADLPGSTAMITLGLWDNFVGTPFMQASTTLHELGHNVNLWHGGAPPIWGTKTTSTVVEPNCKPNYLSSMSYLYQAHGLADSFGNVNLDYSRGVNGITADGTVYETGVSDGALSPAAPYQSAWYAPMYLGNPAALSPLATILGVSKAKRFCDGAKFAPAAPPVDTARMHPASGILSIDWNGDNDSAGYVAQDGNFNGTTGDVLRGYNDQTGLRLDQIGAARSVRIFPRTDGSSGDFLDFGSGDFLDFGAGDFLDFGSGDFLDFGSGSTYYVDFGSGDFLDFGSGDFLDFGSGDFLDFGSGLFLTDPSGDQGASGDFSDFGAGDFLDFGSGDFLDFGSGDFLDFGSGDFLDFGSGDFLDFGAGDFLDFGAGSQELDYDAARGLGRAAPSGLKACVVGEQGCTPAPAFDPLHHRVQLRWVRPTVGTISSYQVYRLSAATVTPQNIGSAVPVGSPTTATEIIDTEELPNGVPFTYFVKATFQDDASLPVSGASNFAMINRGAGQPNVARDDAPVPVDDSYTTKVSTALTVPVASGVLANDTDVDTRTPLKLVLPVFVAPQHGTVVLNADGAFTYTPVPGYAGTDTFKYKVNDGPWTRNPSIPLSSDSIGTVTITIRRGR